MDSELFGKGAVDRPEDFLQADGLQHIEIAGAFPPALWIEKDPTKDFITYPKRNQYMTSACVTYWLAKQLSVDEFSENGVWRELSPHSIYPYGYVPEGGMNSLVASNLVVKQGMTLESLLPSDGLSEAMMRKSDTYAVDAKQVALVYKPESFVECATDFDTIYSIIEGYKKLGQKKVVGVTIIGQNNGTWLTSFPKPPSGKENLWYHRITITDGGIIKGKRYLSFDNSWGEQVNQEGIKGQQFIGEEYAPFIYAGIYTLNISDKWQHMSVPDVKMPTYQWSMDLSVGSTGQDVTKLQEALQSIGMFPISKFVAPTGNFFGITKNAVLLFQGSFALPQTGMVDLKTRDKLNSIFKG